MKTTLTALAALLSAHLVHAAPTPIQELYGNHLTFLANFDEGNFDSVAGEEKHPYATNKVAFADDGLFGTRGFAAGSARYGIKKGSKILDLKRPGTVLFWLKLNEPFDPIPKVEPASTFFKAEWTPTKRLLIFRQAALKWGGAAVDVFLERPAKDGRRVVSRVGSGGAGSLKNWKAGEWHLVAGVWRPDSLSLSFDGKPFAKTALGEPLGAFSGAMGIGLDRTREGKPLYTMDDLALLDFPMSDEQVAALYRDYRARLQETRTEQDPVIALTHLGAGQKRNSYEATLTIRNTGTRTLQVVYDFGARPIHSQPVKRHEVLTIRPKATRKVTTSGPALDDETIDAVIRVSRADGSRIFNCRRLFSTAKEEPEWMRSPSAVSFRFAYYPYANTIHVETDISNCENFGRVRTLRLTVSSRHDGREIAATNFPAQVQTGQTEIFWRNLPELDGDCVCRLSSPDSTEIKAEQTFVRHRFAWERNKLGLSSAIPAPFEPVEKKGNHVKVVLRDHTIGEYGLWDQVMAAGKPLLARPMRLVANGACLSHESQWDVDGLMLWRLTLAPGHHEPMTLEIPIREERAYLFHPVTDGLRSNFAGRIPAGRGKVWDSKKYPRNSIVGTFLPYIWLGGPLRGIAVCGDNDRGWVTDAASACYEIVREPGVVILRLNLIQKAVDLAAPQTIKIGFQATPVKPMPENWRAMSHGLLLGACYYWGGYWDSHVVEPFDETDEYWQVMGEERRTGVFNKAYLEKAVESYPYPFAKGTAAYDDQKKRIRAHFNNGLWNAAANFKGGGKFVFYTNGRGVFYGDKTGRGATFCNEWNRFAYVNRDFTPLSMKAYDLDPVESYRDYATSCYARMLKTGACDYLYWDDVYCSANFNLVETDAYRLPTGQIQPSLGIFNMRANIRRCAVLQTELGKDCRGNWVHMTNTAMAPISAFAGVNYDWEDSSGQEPPQVKYSKDYILAETIGRQFGNRVGIMGYFDFALDKKGEKYRSLAHAGAGVMLTHELRWNESGHEDYAAAHKFLCDWGYRTPAVEVWNYWDEDIPFPVVTKGLDVAAIALAKRAVTGKGALAGEAMICISSFEGRDGTVTVVPDALTLGLGSSWKASNALTGEALPVADGRLSVALPKYDWILIKLEK